MVGGGQLSKVLHSRSFNTWTHLSSAVGVVAQQRLAQVRLKDLPKWLAWKTPTRPRDLVKMVQKGELSEIPDVWASVTQLSPPRLAVVLQEIHRREERRRRRSRHVVGRILPARLHLDVPTYK